MSKPIPGGESDSIHRAADYATDLEISFEVKSSINTNPQDLTI